MTFSREFRLRWLNSFYTGGRPGLYLSRCQALTSLDGYPTVIGYIVWSPYKGLKILPPLP